MNDSGEITEQPPVPIATDSYRGVAELIALLNDRQGVASRLKALQEHEANMLKAVAALAAERMQFQEESAKVRAELDALRERLAERDLAVTAREGKVEHFAQMYRERQEALDRREGRYLRHVGGNGLTQSIAPDPPPGPAVEESIAASDAAWCQPSAGATVTRTTHTRSRGRRAAADL
jgi:hypothetical protein